jgi:hypothetical protein
MLIWLLGPVFDFAWATPYEMILIGLNLPSHKPSLKKNHLFVALF